jgi:hypothetical protein
MQLDADHSLNNKLHVKPHTINRTFSAANSSGNLPKTGQQLMLVKCLLARLLDMNETHGGVRSSYVCRCPNVFV